ncbi:hypothetical protein ACWDTT_06395 [Streptosporangium sandarakinum]|uniref:hypothetical protein n=1 Tax=Streptosporangium TaxID=2000 RepID=UPI0031F93A96
MRIHRMTTLGGVVAMLLTTLTPLTSLAPAASAAAAPPAANAACPEDTGQATCLLRAATGGGDRPLPNGAATTGGGPLTAKDLQEAYRLPADWLGGGQTVAIVSPYDNVTAEDELAEYRKVNGMPPCDADFPCFRKVNQRGGDTPPAPSPAWSLHGTIGLELAAAACPNCKLLLVQADDESLASMAAAVDQAAAQGATAVVPMWGVAEHEGQGAQAAHFDHTRTAVVAPSGMGFNSGGRQTVPAAYPSVIAVGGTQLHRDPATARGWNESVWRDTASGCSMYELRPAWQPRGACGTRRTVADVSAVASADTPVQVYSSRLGGWGTAAGTPVAAAFIAGVYGLAGTDSATPAGKRLYAASRYLNDITAGSNGACGGGDICTAVRGYDGPSGMGTPNGTGAF